MATSFKVTIKSNTKVWDQIKKRMLNPKERSVDVGWFSEAKYDNGIPVAWIALLNEYGYVTSGKYKGYHPPRPFFRTFWQAYSTTEIATKLHIIPLVQQVSLGKMTWNQLYKEVGDNLVKLVKERIVDYKIPRNSPLTISLKGFDDPLIETKTMLNTIRYRISRSKRTTGI